jgi:hypothetical protein
VAGWCVLCFSCCGGIFISDHPRAEGEMIGHTNL